MRPAHLHFLIYKPGFKTHISQVYTDDDPNLETDSQFGVTQALIGHYVRHDNGPGAGTRRQGGVVFARLHVRHRARYRQMAAPAHQRQGARRPARDRTIEAGMIGMDA